MIVGSGSWQNRSHTHNRVAGCNGKSSQTGKLEVAGERRKEKGKGEISKSFSLFMGKERRGEWVSYTNNNVHQDEKTNSERVKRDRMVMMLGSKQST